MSGATAFWLCYSAFILGLVFGAVLPQSYDDIRE